MDHDPYATGIPGVYLFSAASHPEPVRHGMCATTPPAGQLARL